MQRFKIKISDSVCPGAASVALSLPSGRVVFYRRPEPMLEHHAELSDELALELAARGYEVKTVKATPARKSRRKAAAPAEVKAEETTEKED